MSHESLIGKDLGGASFPVERGKVRELVRALGDDDPVYTDLEAARAAGFERIPVPPTFTVTLTHWLGADMGFGALGLDLERVLHGESSWEYLAPVYVGDQLTASRRVSDVTTREGKRGGTMAFITLATEFGNGDGKTVIRQKDLIIERAGEG
ncbi:MAG: MaoC family dehydratase N-terminal domain-containing protein [Thermoleophilaceae bacterium]